MVGVLIIVAIVLAVAAVVVVIPTVLAIVRVARRWSRDRSAPELQSEARVVDKRAQVTHRGATGDQRYFVTFQFPDGGRLELEVQPSEAGMLVVGDQGVLDWRGARYLGFAREILR